MAAALSNLNRREEPSWLPSRHAPFAGKYAVGRVLGQGGMGIVFEARHIRLGHRVAIKVLGSALREYPELVQRFEREARAAGSLTSAHVVRVLDIDATADGTPFIVMELLAGCDLSHVVENDGPQPVARAVRWILEACDAIGEAHRLGIVHRDLKPSNLFLADVDGRPTVKVLVRTRWHGASPSDHARGRRHRDPAQGQGQGRKRKLEQRRATERGRSCLLDRRT